MSTVLLFILGVLVIVVGLAVSIALHELGHLVPAKRFGVRVGQYMIGFGPTIVSRKRGETEYGLKAIPLGGYISMSGMYPPAKPGGAARTASTGFFDTLVQDARDASADTVTDGEEHRTFSGLPIWKRVVIMLGGPFMNLVQGILLYAIVLCGFGIAVPGTTVASVSECVIAASADRTDCAASDPVAPAASGGIEPGDRIVEVAGEPITDWASVQSAISERAGEAIDFVIERDGATQTISITPLETERLVYDAAGDPVEVDGEQVTEQVGFIGIGPQYEIEQQSVTAVLPAVGDNISRVVGVIVTLPQRLVDVAVAAFGGGERDPEGPISVVGVGRMAGEIAALDQVPVLERVSAMVSILASLNIALFVFNLIPLMPLDGGHVLAALIDAVRRGWARMRGRERPAPVDSAKWVPVTLAVAVVLGAMSVLLIYADIVNPVSLFGG